MVSRSVQKRVSSRRQRRLTTLLTSTAFTGAFIAVIAAYPQSALADGGAGGASGNGAAGGAGGTLASPIGQAGAAGGGGGGGGGPGGGGGAAGARSGSNGGNGGQGGLNGNGTGAATITNTSSLAGGAGDSGGSLIGVFGDGAGDGGGGGGGGAGGYGAIATGAGPSSNTSTIAGGQGGNGGAGGDTGIGDNGGSGGGGGAGGVGVQFTATGANFTNSGTIIGGAGGLGASGQSPGFGAAGGDGGSGAAGGVGVQFTATGASLTNSGTIIGGAGGSGGSGGVSSGGFFGAAGPPDGSDGLSGVGGAGVVGAGLTIINSGTITGGLAGDGVTRANAITFTGGTNSLIISGTSVINGNVVAASTADTFGLGGTISATFNLALLGAAGSAVQYQGFGILQKSGTSTWTVFGTPGTPLAYQITAGALDLNGATQGATSLLLTGGTLQNGTLTSAGTFDVQAGTVSAALAGTGGVTKTTAGTVIFSGANSYTGATNINGGILEVDGSIATSSLTTVNANAELTGIGTAGNTQVNAGGIFTPGNGTPGTSMTVNGSLAFASGAFYMVQVNPTTASLANVSGTATLGGASVLALFSSGSYVTKQYTILNAAGGVSGTFNALANTNLPAGFTSSLSYDATHAYLNLALKLLPSGPSTPTGPSAPTINNQSNVATNIVNFFNANGFIPIAFGMLTQTGLTQVSGELAAGSQQTTFNAMTQFIGVMTDPFVAGRGDGVSAGGGATGYADEANANAAERKPNDALAAIYTKAPPIVPFEQRWNTWVAGYGGSQTTDGNAVLGSNSTTSSIYGTAVGADYRFSPFTIAGFALAGGGTSFSLANGLGSGRSDLFQAGAYVRHTMGAAYIAGALAYGWQDITTNRTVTLAGLDQLQARFNANAFSGRLEGGYRFVSPWMDVGITPYAAAQFTTFDLPAYAEQAVIGTNNFALAYGAKGVTDPRSELGFRTDKSYVMQDGVLTLRGRLAWAHDYDPDRAIGATFQTLPGASFVVNGAAQASDSVLTTASIERNWINNWSIAATFEGEFSSVTSSYAGKGVVRYAW
jgi:uncharacterized protein with beta-barrel porin domain